MNKLPSADVALQRTLIFRKELAQYWLDLFFDKDALNESIAIAYENGASRIKRQTDLLEPEVIKTLVSMISASNSCQEMRNLGYHVWTLTHDYHNTTNKKLEMIISWERK